MTKSGLLDLLQQCLSKFNASTYFSFLFISYGDSEEWMEENVSIALSNLEKKNSRSKIGPSPLKDRPTLTNTFYLIPRIEKIQKTI